VKKEEKENKVEEITEDQARDIVIFQLEQRVEKLETRLKEKEAMLDEIKYSFDVLKGFGTFPPMVPEKKKDPINSDDSDAPLEGEGSMQNGNFTDKTNDLIALGLIMFMLIILTFTLTFIGVKYLGT
jgi:uncharacterized protein (UPF0335 family)